MEHAIAHCRPWHSAAWRLQPLRYIMKKFVLALGLLSAMPFVATAPSFAQGKPQTLTSINVQAVATGFRASKIIGATITNDVDEKIGTVDDLIVNHADRVPYAIISVGGFLGVGD